MSASSSIRVVPAAGPAARGVGKYRYIALLAESGMADVYLAVTRAASFEKLVVIKQLRAELAADPSFVTMFMNEAGLAARLNHPNVVQTHEVGVDEGAHFLAMEFLEGVTYLRLARLRERIPAPLAFHVRVLADALHGLHYAHELRDYQGAPLEVVHRDVSPHNVMITFAGVVKVLDFGIAKAALAVEQHPDAFKGKLEYMAPEQARREPVDRRADVFAVGVMLWEALARRRLYQPGEDKYERLVSGALPDVLQVRPDAPRRLAQICARAMAHDPASRYATALEMALEFEDWLDGTTQRVSAREVGAYVSEKFASTRRRLSEAIEAQLETVRTLPDGATSLPLARIPFTEVPQALPSGPDPNGSGALPLPPLTEPSWAGGPGTAASTGTASAPSTWSSEPVPITGWPSTPVGSPRPPARGGAAMIAVGLVAGFALASAGFAALHVAGGRTMQAPKPASVAPPAPTPATSASEPPAEVEVTVRAEPAESRIWIDGKAVAGNPSSARRPRDGAIHVVRVEAKGHDPKEVQLAFDRSVLVTVDLRPSPPAAASVAASSSAPSPARRWGTPPPRAKGGPKASLDTENPYQ